MKLTRIIILFAAALGFASLYAFTPEVSSTANALGRLSVVNIRSTAAHKAELVTQALMGMPLRISDTEGDWVKVETPDGYNGWTHRSSVVRKTDAEMNNWRTNSNRYVVTATAQTYGYDNPDTLTATHVVTDLVNGDILERIAVNTGDGKQMQMTLPDGRRCWVDADDMTPIAKWADQKYDADKILDMARSMMGQPYLWGGTSIKGADCSGLVKLCYLANGIILRRDASQQALTGTKISAGDWHSCRRGDLLFFGNGATKKVTHVALYDSDGKYIHSSGRVMRNSLDPDSPIWLGTTLLHCCRISDRIGTPGIVRASDHTWYFNK